MMIYAILQIAVLAMVSLSGLGATNAQIAKAPTYEIGEYDVYVGKHREWLEDLAECESNNRNDIKIIDTNGMFSYGRLQFQLKTFLGFGKQYKIIATSTTLEQGRELIKDQRLTDQVAARMREDGIDGKHWVNCTKKIGGAVDIAK